LARRLARNGLIADGLRTASFRTPNDTEIWLLSLASNIVQELQSSTDNKQIYSAVPCISLQVYTYTASIAYVWQMSTPTTLRLLFATKTSLYHLSFPALQTNSQNHVPEIAWLHVHDRVPLVPFREYSSSKYLSLFNYSINRKMRLCTFGPNGSTQSHYCY